MQIIYRRLAAETKHDKSNSFSSVFQLLHTIDEIVLVNTDATFSATLFALADLAKHQDIQEKVRVEVDEILHGCEPSSFEDLGKMLPYMEMVLKESARMHPVISLSLPEKTVKPVTELGDYLIPRGVKKAFPNIFIT